MNQFRLPTSNEFFEITTFKRISFLDLLFNISKLKSFDGIFLVSDAVNHDEFASTAVRSQFYSWVFCTTSNQPVLMPSMFAANVRLVRQGPTAGNWQEGDNPFKRFALSSCKTFVTDNKTGLEWKRNKESVQMHRAEAFAKFS